MKIKIAVLAQNMKTIEVKGAATVKKVLEKARITPRGDVYVNGRRAGMASKLKNGDIIGIVGQVQGG